MLRHGSCVWGKTLTTRGDDWMVTTSWQQEIRIDHHDLLQATFAHQGAVALSTLAPAKKVVVPYFDQASPPRVNRTVEGNLMRFGSGTISTGVGVTSGTTLTYDVAGKSRFVARVGLDRSAGPQASVRFEVRADDRVVFNSGEMLASSSPQFVSIDLTQSQTLSLHVDWARRGNIQDVANWADAYLLP